MVTVSRPSGVDVSVNNPRTTVYITGNESTDGSIRIRPDTSLGTQAEFQLRTNGVWNDTGLQIAASSVHMGRELLVSGAGHWIRTENADQEDQTLVPHIQFSEEEGTVLYAHIPILEPLEEDAVFQSIDTDILSGSSVGWIFQTVLNALTKEIGIKTEDAPTNDLLLRAWRGTDDTGVLYYSRIYPQSDFPAETTVTLLLDGVVEAVADEFSFIEFSCVDSEGVFDPTGTVSLKGSDTLDQPYQEYSFYSLTIEDVMTSTTGIDRVLTSCVTAGSIIDISGNLVLSGESPEHVVP